MPKSYDTELRAIEQYISTLEQALIDVVELRHDMKRAVEIADLVAAIKQRNEGGA